MIPPCSAVESYASCAQMNFFPSPKHWPCNRRHQRVDVALSLSVMVEVAPLLAEMPSFVLVWRYPSSVSRPRSPCANSCRTALPRPIQSMSLELLMKTLYPSLNLLKPVSKIPTSMVLSLPDSSVATACYSQKPLGLE